MIRDLLRERPASGDVADVCVVGAGAAGLLLAVELTRQGKRVMVVEGGGREVEEPAQEPYRSEVVGHVHRGIHGGRFRAHGGTTTRWGGQIFELDEEDFARREWVEGSGWPISKQELEPFYRRALAFEGIGGAIREDAEVWRRLGLRVPEFSGLESYFTRWCPEPNFARLHAKVLEESETLQVWLHANAVELVLEGERAVGLRCRTQAGQEMVVRAGQIVFCMGAIECVRFFLQPRESGLPWNASGMLGRHFQDHVDANAAEVRPRDRRRFAELFDNVFLGRYKYHPKLRLAAEQQRRAGVLNCAATMNFSSELDEALSATKATAKHLLRGRWGEVKAGEVLRTVGQLPLLVRQTARYGMQHRAYNPESSQIWLRVHCEQRPDGESSICLSEERDSLGLLRARLDWRVSELELRTIRTYAEVAAKSMSEVAEIEPDAQLMAGDEAFLARCDDSNHHMGGMRMAASASKGVVSPELLLHGTRNAYVCSGAVFPTSGFSNPTHTVLALAMRLADRLARV